MRVGIAAATRVHVDRDFRAQVGDQLQEFRIPVFAGEPVIRDVQQDLAFGLVHCCVPVINRAGARIVDYDPVVAESRQHIDPHPMDIVRVYPEQVFYILRMIALSEPRCSGILPLRKSRGRMAKAKNYSRPKSAGPVALQQIRRRSKSEQIQARESLLRAIFVKQPDAFRFLPRNLAAFGDHRRVIARPPFSRDISKLPRGFAWLRWAFPEVVGCFDFANALLAASGFVP